MSGKDNSLRGRIALLTRSEHQCARLAGGIEARGGRVLAAPCVRIEFADSPKLLSAARESLAWADTIVLTSANAVEGLARLAGLDGLLAGRRLYAVGPATKRRITSLVGDSGRIECPSGGSGAARLLEIGSLRRLSGRRIALARGVPTLGNISPELIKRGAEVRELELYASHTLVPQLSSGLAGIGPAAIDGVLVSSMGALRGISQACQQEPWIVLKSAVGLIAASGRIGAAASGLGWRRVLCSERPDDDSLIECFGDMLAKADP